VTPDGYLRGVLADGARPFRHRAGVCALLGLPENTGVRVSFGRTVVGAGFTYLRHPRGASEAYLPGEALSAAPRSWDRATEVLFEQPLSVTTLDEPPLAGMRDQVSTSDSAVVIPGTTPRPERKRPDPRSDREHAASTLPSGGQRDAGAVSPGGQEPPDGPDQPWPGAPDAAVAGPPFDPEPTAGTDGVTAGPTGRGGTIHSGRPRLVPLRHTGPAGTAYPDGMSGEAGADTARPEQSDPMRSGPPSGPVTGRPAAGWRPSRSPARTADPVQMANLVQIADPARVATPVRLPVSGSRPAGVDRPAGDADASSGVPASNGAVRRSLPALRRVAAGPIADGAPGTVESPPEWATAGHPAGPPAQPAEAPPVAQVVVVRQPARTVSTPAFWERRHLGRLGLRARILR
jgi:hypothetical protein